MTPLLELVLLLTNTCNLSCRCTPAAATTKSGVLKISSAFLHKSATRLGCTWVICASFHATLSLATLSRELDCDKGEYSYTFHLTTLLICFLCCSGGHQNPLYMWNFQWTIIIIKPILTTATYCFTKLNSSCCSDTNSNILVLNSGHSCFLKDTFSF